MSIHKLTYIHPEAIIGNNVTIEPFTTIEKNVVIGSMVTLLPIMASG